MGYLHLEPISAMNSGELEEIAREFEQAGEGRFELAAADPDAFFQSVEMCAAGHDLPPNQVQQDEYWLFDQAHVVGSCRVRHYLLPTTAVEGGHIGYEIRPSERGKGYGTAILRLALAKARQIGLDWVLITVYASNLASIRVIEKNGGVLQDECQSPFSPETICRFWISLGQEKIGGKNRDEENKTGGRDSGGSQYGVYDRSNGAIMGGTTGAMSIMLRVRVPSVTLPFLLQTNRHSAGAMVAAVPVAQTISIESRMDS